MFHDNFENYKWVSDFILYFQRFQNISLKNNEIEMKHIMWTTYWNSQEISKMLQNVFWSEMGGMWRAGMIQAEQLQNTVF